MKNGLILCAVLLSSVISAPSADSLLADLGQGIEAWNAHDYKSTVMRLQGRQVPKLSDYVVYHLASAEQLTGDYDSALSILAGYRQEPVQGSPLAGKISLLHARVLLDKRDPPANAKALDILQSDYNLLPQPDGDFALGLAYEALGEKPQSALAYERVYYSYPKTDLAAQSWTAMERLRGAMGSDFPKPPGRQQLERCEKWLVAKSYNQARLEYSALLESLTGLDKEAARVGIGAADFLAGNANAAFRYLKDLRIPHSDPDAQRLYYLTEAARKIGNDAVMMDAIKDLGEHYPKSVWRLKALVTAGNRYLVTNDRDKYAPLFKAASDSFPSDNSTAYCHWKVAWDAYLDGKPDRVSLLKEQVERYPGDSRASSALYFLGRTAENEDRQPEARAYYDELSLRYPHYFYGVLARERIKAAKILAAAADDSVKTWLAGIDWPVRRDFSAKEPNAATKQRIERARLLILAALPDLAEAEIRFGAKSDQEQPQLLALALAGAASSPFESLRIMKSFSSDYLALPTEGASAEFWRMLFPLPYKDDVFRNARQRGLDPYYVAALIRQESEFNPSAKSHANAYGLMQLIPSTGRMLGRQQGIPALRTSMLLEPALNIQLGTLYLRSQLDTWTNDWYKTLAAYDAGPGRVRQWLTWGKFNEPAEFVESIPFNETREYVQAVLRNADMYRELYDGKLLPDGADPRPVLKASTVAKNLPAQAIAAKAAKKPVASGKKSVAAKRAAEKKRPPA